MKPLTTKEKELLVKIGDDVLCFTPRSRHFDQGYYLLSTTSQVESRPAAALIRKEALIRLDSAPEKKPPPGAVYYKRKKIVMHYDLENTFTCTCGQQAEKSGWVAAHLNERLTYTCPKCSKKWVLEDMFVEEL